MSQRHPVSSGRTRSYHERRPCNPPTGSNPSPRQPHESTSDLQPVIEQLEQGDPTGDPIPDLSHTVFKLRVRNRDILQQGKSGGDRLSAAAFPLLPVDRLVGNLFR